MRATPVERRVLSRSEKATIFPDPQSLPPVAVTAVAPRPKPTRAPQIRPRLLPTPPPAQRLPAGGGGTGGIEVDGTNPLDIPR
ncbi:MAG: hypothetical protein H7Z41_09180 [Cytophagales bacterium]|nr:hypothetical protein [Armatimonadota bacterium]